MNDQFGSTIAFAATAPLLLLILYVFRALPWTRPGPWRTVVALAALAAIMFMVSEAAVIAEGDLHGADPSHQLPLFLAVLSASTAATVAYLEGARAAERARRLALTDPLTGLRNRRAFEEALRIAYEQPRPFSLVYIDLDGFKAINDRFGHEVGDNALQHTAAAFLRAVREGDTTARLGGDEFALLLPTADPQTAERIAKRALEELLTVTRDHPDWKGLTGSFGVASRGDASSSEALIERADRAMYSAKRAGGGRVAYASATAGTAAHEGSPAGM